MKVIEYLHTEKLARYSIYRRYIYSRISGKNNGILIRREKHLMSQVVLLVRIRISFCLLQTFDSILSWTSEKKNTTFLFCFAAETEEKFSNKIHAETSPITN